MQSSCCLYIWAYGQIYFNVFKKIQVLVGNQRVIAAFAGLKGMQGKNQSEIKVSKGSKYVQQVPFCLLICVMAQSLAGLLLAG